MMRRFAAPLLAVALAAGCNPLSCCAPGELPKDAPLVLSSTSATWPKEKVEVRVDENGVPHVKAAGEPDVAYGLGFMQGRDRTFQLFVLKKAMSGRLTEVFGEGMLPTDQFLRLVSYRSDEALDVLDARDRDLLDAFAAGVNDGAKNAGGSAEMGLLGATWEPWEARDALNMSRYLQLDQSGGWEEERARVRVLDRLPPGDPRVAELVVDVPSGGVPVVANDEFSGARPAQASTASSAPRAIAAPKRVDKLPSYEKAPSRDVARRALENAPPHVRGIVASFLDDGPGLSNAWAVKGHLTRDGAAMLANDPHLRHETPSLWYLAHLQAPDLDVVGACVAGTPFVGIGRGARVAWGFTNAFADNMDLVEIALVDGRDDMYLLDGVETPFGTITQRYVLGDEDGAPVVEETWRTTVFGPVLPPGWTSELDDGHVWALLWAPWVFQDEGTTTVSALYDLAKATTSDAAGAALQRMVAPVFNASMLFDDGTIAHRLTGYLPVRASDEPLALPRDGRTRAAGWLRALPVEQMPQLRDPARGWLNATNQRVVEDDGPAVAAFGTEGAEPWRALRVDERIRALLDEGKPSPEELFAIQQDVVHVGARAHAPVLGARCPARVEGHPDDRVARFCDGLRSFDGAFTKDATGALPWAMLFDALVVEAYGAHVGADVADSIKGQSFVRVAVHRALDAVEAGEEPLLFDDPRTDGYDGVDAFVARAAKAALDQTVELVGEDPNAWRWGAAHRRKLAGQLAAAPVIGALFESAPLEQPGFSNTPRAESGIPWVRGGAGLRLFATAKDGVLSSKMVIDTGQSGHVGTKHWGDMFAPWDRGETLDLHVDDYAAHVAGQVDLLPAASSR